MGSPLDGPERADPAGSPPAEAASTADEGDVDAPLSGAAAKATASLGVLDAISQKLAELDGLRRTLTAVVAENAKLKADNQRLSKALVDAAGGAQILRALNEHKESVEIKDQQVKDLLEENTDLNGRLLELEELNSSMMSMYVSSYQLHATLDLDEVIRTIAEIVVNFIGAEAYAILVAEEDGRLAVASEVKLDGRLPSTGIEPRGVLSEVLEAQTAYVHTSTRPAREGILAAVPLQLGEHRVGAVLIYSLFSQKEQLLSNDVELLSLLGGHAASAIMSARLYARADRKLKTLEGVLDLLGSGAG